jgi:magnesium-protoporphyrin O-methyltransferase
MGCCSPGGYDQVFGEKAARKDLRRYRRRGLKSDARRGLAFARSRGVHGASVLEAGGGIGAIQVELLRAGASRAVNVELSRGYEQAAAELLTETGLAERVERRIGDFVEEEAQPADVVVMNRVVCCYPDPKRLVGTAARRAKRLLVLTFPSDDPVARAVAWAGNVLLRLSRSDFRAYAHAHRTIHRAAEEEGLRLVHESRGLVWHTAGYERARVSP